MNENYLILQEWLRFLASLPVAMMFVGAAILWIVAQMLDNTWAGGKLFERKHAWISTSLAAVVIFGLLVVPNVTWPVALGVVCTAVLVGIAFLQKKHWK